MFIDIEKLMFLKEKYRQNKGITMCTDETNDFDDEKAGSFALDFVQWQNIICSLSLIKCLNVAVLLDDRYICFTVEEIN